MRVRKWKTLSRTEVFNHPRLRLVEDEVALPNGQKITYLRYAPCETFSVAVLAIDTDQKLLLQREYSYPPHEILWQLPGGGAHRGETIEEAAKRELAEESGVTAATCRTIGFVYTNNRRSDEKQYIVVCTDLKPQKTKGDPEEFIENHWLSVQEIRQMITSGAVHNINLLAALCMYSACIDND